ncbi:MAG: M1 family peptidase, partial [Bacteroidetes bacterium]
PFSVNYFSSSSGIPVSSWVFPQDREAGFFDFGMAALPLDFFESYIGTYPFSKLANVQSKTVYGGMENAGCIFYHENAITGKRDQEQLIAHEIAHQWFGDAVTEGDWHHIWLSEGFATYLADLYLEERFGTDSMFSSLVEEREQVIRFTKMAFFPVIDTTRPVSVGLLNPNTYEKAAWFLHMLRSETGDSIFRECIRSFYRNFRYGNVLTEDFLSVVDSVSGKSYRSFFDQWLRIAGHPIISASWEQSGPEILLRIRQCQVHHVYSFPLDLQVVSGGVTEERTVYVDRAVQDFRIPFSREKADIRLDPGCRLLFEYCPEDQ